MEMLLFQASCGQFPVADLYGGWRDAPGLNDV